MKIIELIKVLLYGSLILNYVAALNQHKENVFDKSKISNEQTNRPQTTRIRRSEITETTEKITSNATYAYIASATVHASLLLPDFIIPKKYKIELTLDLEKDIFYGECDISIMISRTTQKISLHLANLEINKFTLSKIIDEDITMYVTGNITYIHELQIVVLNFVDILYPGKYTLRIIYKGFIATDGGFVKTSYRNATGDKKWLIVINNSATGMRRLFPCWDEPGLKAKFTIAIWHAEHYNVFSNIALLNISTSETLSLALSFFATTSEILAYRIGIVIFDKNDYTNISLIQNHNLWSRESMKMQWWNQTLQLIKDVIIMVEYRLIKYKPPEGFLMTNQYAITGLIDGGMDKFQFVLYREEDIIYNEEIDPIACQIKLSRIIGRKVIGQLFSNVNPSRWSYMWLNEGIATLFGVYIINQIMPDSRMLDLFVVQTQQESLRLDDSHIMNPLDSEVNSISEINSLFSFTYYIKAPSILRMLHHIMGDKIFQEGIKVYMKRETGSLDDFWTVMQSVYDSQTMDLEKLNVKDLMNPWIQEKQYPILNVTEIFNSEWTKIFLETASKNWMVPLRSQVYINLKQILPKICKKMILLVTQQYFLEKCYNSEHSQFIIINQQQIGYYRVFYNFESWLKIIKYLNSENYTNINTLNRAQIIDDTFHLTISGELDSSVFWDVVSYLKWETDYIPWYSMFKAAEHMSYILPFNSTDSTIFKRKLQMQLGPLLQKIENEEKSNEDNFIKCLRQEALRWACVLGDSECKKYAEFKLQWHLLNTTENKLLPWWKEWTFCNGLSVSCVSFDELFKNVDKVSKIKYLEMLKLLACCNNIKNLLSLFDNLKWLRNYFVSTDDARTITFTKFYINLFYYVIQRHANNASFSVVLLKDLEEIKSKEISTTAALINIINYTYSSKLLCEIQKWAHKNLTNSLLQNIELKINVRLMKYYVRTIDEVCTINEDDPTLVFGLFKRRLH